jgi:site-specific DNA-methyltransferase (adenine-specific)
MLQLNKIYLGDCIDLFKSIDDSSIDLIIADPPYNLGKDFGNNSDNWDSVDKWLEWTRKWLDESKRVLKQQGAMFVFGIHHYLCYIQVYLYSIGMVYGRQFIWHYENGWSKYKNSPAATYEPILWFKKSEKHTYHPIREPYKSADRLRYRITKHGKVWEPNLNGRMAGDIWRVPTLAGRRYREEKVDHPTQKPLALCERMVKHFSNFGDLILVPFAGSGTECVSAVKNNRKFIGFEINPKYVHLAEKRLGNFSEIPFLDAPLS